ncbi:MAG: substrate-binding domain-containing protein [Armatimonadota bacterium]
MKTSGRTRAARVFGLTALLASVAFATGCKKPREATPPPGPGVTGPSTTGPEAPPSATPAGRKWKIGFSQCTTSEPWRVLFDDLLRKEAEKHADECEVIFQDAQDRTEEQVAQMEAFINQKVDAILISPKESAGLTDVVKRATAAGIPVIVLDRDVDTDEYACFIGGDNTEIGREAGKYAVELLGGEGNARGKIYEIWGGMGSTPAQQRHAGFAEVVEKEPGITLVGKQDGDWKQDKGYDIMETALKSHKDIDVVYAHNDPMAYGAYLAAKDAGREKEIKFIGIDGIPDEGCKWVKEGKLAGTFVYPPPGADGLRVALDILNGRAPEKKRILLPTRRITKETVDEYLKEKGIL